MVELVPITNFTAPNISMSPNFAASVSSDVRTAINTRLTKDRDAIQEFPTDFNTWIDVGVQYKNGGDYVMAVKVWDYASKKWPSNVISFNNLGDLYMNYTHEYAKAEKNYLADINIKPEDINGYSTLFELYTATSYHPSATSAEDILKKGIAANPNAFDLRVTLARYYKAAGRTADAKVQYDAAIAGAKAAGKNDVAAQIQQEAISSQ